MTSLNLKTETRSQLFFERYRYVIKFSVPFSFILRGCTNKSYKKDEIRTRVSKRFKLHKNSNNVFKTITINHWRNNQTFNSNEITTSLESIYDVLNSIKSLNRISYISDIIALYTNDRNVLDTINSMPLLSCVTAKEAVVALPENSIYRKNSVYKYRIYLKEIKVSSTVKHNIDQFLKTYDEYINPSDGLKLWLIGNFLRINRWYFFDTNSADLEYMFDLIAPGIKRQVSRIISDKYNTEEDSL